MVMAHVSRDGQCRAPTHRSRNCANDGTNRYILIF